MPRPEPPLSGRTLAARDTYIGATGRVRDGRGDLNTCLTLEARLRRQGVPLRELVIDPLAVDWSAPEQPGRFRSGCAPLEALAEATAAIEEGAPAVVIRGEDCLRSGYSSTERQARMAIYGSTLSIPEAYTRLAHHFMARHGLDSRGFRALADALLENHRHAYLRSEGTEVRIASRWFRPLTALFRGVDCANPVQDFAGRLLLVGQETLTRLDLIPAQCTRVLAVATRRLPQDGPEAAATLARYAHLEEACRALEEAAERSLSAECTAGNLLLEAYSCYPVAPLGLLLASGLVADIDQTGDFLDRHAVTQTGGLNLARAPWNNPALNGLIAMHEALKHQGSGLGLVQGNGGLGYRQGVALLSRRA